MEQCYLGREEDNRIGLHSLGGQLVPREDSARLSDAGYRNCAKPSSQRNRRKKSETNGSTKCAP
jgi:hypothetical protein